MLLVIDDLHRADRSSLALLQFLAPQLATLSLMVLGTYQKIAEFMQKCGTQRIPVRVTAFRISHTGDKKAADPELLKAEITVEAFRASNASLERMKEI